MSNYERKKQSVEDAFRELERNVELGLDFSGRGSVDSLDLVDSYKKSLCLKFAKFCDNNVINEESAVEKSGSISIVEIKAIFAFRSERLTIERLAELYGCLIGDNNLVIKMKQKLLSDISGNEDLKLVRLNDSIKGLIASRDVMLLNLDFLVSLVEKLDLVQSLTNRKIKRYNEE